MTRERKTAIIFGPIGAIMPIGVTTWIGVFQSCNNLETICREATRKPGGAF